MRKVKIGRPELPANERKSLMFRVRMSAADMAELDRAAGGNTSAWAREVLLRAARLGSGEKGNRTQP